MRAKRSTILSCSWTSPPESGGGVLIIGKYLFRREDGFNPDWMNAFFRASEIAKPIERLKKWAYMPLG